MPKAVVVIVIVAVIGVGGYFVLKSTAKPLNYSQQIVFRSQVSYLPNNPLAAGKAQGDYVEVILPGILYDQPKEFTFVAKSEAKTNTPENAAIAFSSANKEDDKDWILETWTSEDQASISELLDDQEMRDTNRDFFNSLTSTSILGQVSYNDFAIVLARYTNADSTYTLPETFKLVDGEWMATNSLSEDPTWAVVFGAMIDDDVRVAE